MTKKGIFSPALPKDILNYLMLSENALSELKIQVSDFPIADIIYLFGIINLEYCIRYIEGDGSGEDSTESPLPTS
jgi:hypothetical protein